MLIQLLVIIVIYIQIILTTITLTIYLLRTQIKKMYLQRLEELIKSPITDHIKRNQKKQRIIIN